MSVLTLKCPYSSKAGEPVWELARCFPEQGYWSEEDYLELDSAGNMLVEFTDGFVEVLPMPTFLHQCIVKYLVDMLTACVGPQLGKVVFAPLPFRLRKKMWREPDILFIFKEHLPKGAYPDRVDLVVEVVSSGKKARARDYERKRADYAAWGVSEYWIVDPQKEQITVLRLEGGRYVEHGVFKKGARATSVLLPGFRVGVEAVFAAGK